MTREELLKSPEYWVTGIQLDLYNCAERFMEQHKLNRSQLASHLGVSRGYVSQLLNGDYDHKLSKLVELSLAFGYVPNLTFMPVDQYVAMESDIACPSLLVSGKYESSTVSKSVYDYGNKASAWYAGGERKEAA